MTFSDSILTYGYPGLLAALVLEFFGLPVPGEALLLLAGGLVAQGELRLIPTLVTGITGSFTGYILAYEIGRRICWDTLIRWSRYVRMTPRHWEHGEQVWNRYNMPLLTVSRYVPGIRHLTPYLVGLGRMRRRAFYPWNVLGSALWVIPLVLAGSSVGKHWALVETWLRHFGLAATAIGVLALMGTARIRRGTWEAGTGILWLSAALTSCAVVLAFIVSQSKTGGWERTWMEGIQDLATPGLTAFFQLVSAVGSPGGSVLLAMIAGLLWWRRGKRMAVILMTVSLSGASLLEFGMKHVVARPRPTVVRHLVALGGFSYPSGHAAIAIAFWGMLAFIAAEQGVHERCRFVHLGAAVMILLIGFSRVYLGVHWPTDVLGGYLVGGAWLTLLVGWVKITATPLINDGP